MKDRFGGTMMRCVAKGLLLGGFALLMVGCLMGGSDFEDNPVIAPSSVSATTNLSDRIEVSWSGVGGADSYNVYKSSVATGPFDTITFRVASDQTKILDYGVSTGVSYYYAVRAVKDDQLSSLSSVVEGKRSNNTGGTTLGKPVILSVFVSASHYEVVWTQLPGASEYCIFMSTSGDVEANYVRVGTNAPSDHTNFMKNEVQGGGQTYYFRVSGINSSGLEGPRSDPMTYVF